MSVLYNNNLGITSTILRVVDDGEWHQFIEILNHLRPLIRPERALRSHTNACGRKTIPCRHDWMQQQESGTRYVCRDAIAQMVKMRRIEKRGFASLVEIRKRVEEIGP